MSEKNRYERAPAKRRPTARPQGKHPDHPLLREFRQQNLQILLKNIMNHVTAEEFDGLVPMLRAALKQPIPERINSFIFEDVIVKGMIEPLWQKGHELAALALYEIGFNSDLLSPYTAPGMVKLLAHMGFHAKLEQICDFARKQYEKEYGLLDPALYHDHDLEKELSDCLADLEKLRSKWLAEAHRVARKKEQDRLRAMEENRARHLAERFENFRAFQIQNFGELRPGLPTNPEEYGLFEQGQWKPPAPPPQVRAPRLVVSEGMRQIPVSLTAVNRPTDLMEIHGDQGLRAFRVAREAQGIHLLREFDELLCTESLVGVIPHRHQGETARRVLTRFHGRAILADEVGLGKTIEAGLVIKEYLLRGLARRVLILVPPALVSQWHGEMLEKFGLEFATTADQQVRTDPAAFWKEPLVLASMGLARLEPHSDRCREQAWDLIVVDEAHHLRNATSRSHKLVKTLPRRYLLLLTATPVQNHLMELYHLINLLRPGTLGTAADFRRRFIQPRKPTEPLDRDALRALLRTVMIRNTRGFSDVRLPARFASTMRVEPLPREYDLLHFLGRGLAAMYPGADGRFRMTCAALLGQAGSSPLAFLPALERFTEKTFPDGKDLPEAFASCLAAARHLRRSAKDDQLVTLLKQKPGEKVLVFTRFRATLDHLHEVLREQGIPCALFHGQMTGPERDGAVDRFRDDVPVLIATESGGEGRNLQFCRTIVNYDLPWNPMRIEQRIGRLHRIGQTREVFIFNFCLRGSIEERMLAILEDKINLFELVVGEMGMILGHLGEEADFGDLLLDAWLGSTGEEDREARFAALENEITKARATHERIKTFDEALFQEEFEA